MSEPTGAQKVMKVAKTHGSGWVMFLAAMGVMMTLSANDVREMENFTITPAVLGDFMAHIGTVIAAFVAGRLIPKG